MDNASSGIVDAVEKFRAKLEEHVRAGGHSWISLAGYGDELRNHPLLFLTASRSKRIHAHLGSHIDQGGEIMITALTGRIAAAASLVFLLVLAPARAAEPSGVLWETTSQMAMAGMPTQMPTQTMKVCSAKQWTKPPPGGDKSCVASDYKMVGNKATWTMQCSGQMPMQGKGEMTFASPDSYTGAIQATSQGTNMTIKLSGKKVGTCDNPQ
jgi:hypothetical protein